MSYYLLEIIRTYDKMWANNDDKMLIVISTHTYPPTNYVFIYTIVVILFMHRQKHAWKNIQLIWYAHSISNGNQLLVTRSDKRRQTQLTITALEL